MPLAGLRNRRSTASAVIQSPDSKAASSATTSGDGLAVPGTRQLEQSMPPAPALKLRCGPAAPQRAQSSKVGAYPATASDRSRNESRISVGSWPPAAE